MKKLIINKTSINLKVLKDKDRIHMIHSNSNNKLAKFKIVELIIEKLNKNQ